MHLIQSLNNQHNLSLITRRRYTSIASHVQSTLESIAENINNGDKTATISAWEAAQQSLDSTYASVFKSVGSGGCAASSEPTHSRSIWVYVQSAQAALNSLANDVVRSRFRGREKGLWYGACAIEIRYCSCGSFVRRSVGTGQRASLSMTAASDVTTYEVLACIGSVQMALNRLAQDAIAGSPSMADCQVAGGDLETPYEFIYGALE